MLINANEDVNHGKLSELWRQYKVRNCDSNLWTLIYRQCALAAGNNKEALLFICQRSLHTDFCIYHLHIKLQGEPPEGQGFSEKDQTSLSRIIAQNFENWFRGGEQEALKAGEIRMNEACFIPYQYYGTHWQQNYKRLDWSHGLLEANKENRGSEKKMNRQRSLMGMGKTESLVQF